MVLANTLNQSATDMRRYDCDPNRPVRSEPHDCSIPGTTALTLPRAPPFLVNLKQSHGRLDARRAEAARDRPVSSVTCGETTTSLMSCGQRRLTASTSPPSRTQVVTQPPSSDAAT